MKLLPRSLATQALLLGFINAVAVLALGLVTMQAAYHRGLVDFLQAPVQERILAASRTISLDLLENDADSRNVILARAAQGTPFQFALLDNEGKQVAGEPMQFPVAVHEFSSNVTSRHTAIPKFEGNERPENKYSAPNFFLQRDGATGMYWAGVHVLMRDVDDDMYGHGTLIWRFTSLWTNPYFFNSWPYITMIIGALLITSMCWLPAVRALLWRISRLTHATREIAQGNFDVVLPVATADEIGQLTESVALMSRQLSGLLKQQERFVSDAAHELCSPVSRLQMALELLRLNRHSEPPHPPAQVEGRTGTTSYLADVAEEVEQMSELVDDLLFFSRTRHQNPPIRLQEASIAAVVRDAIEREGLSPDKVTVDVAASLRARFSFSHLRRAVANLLRNALQYAGEVGKVEVAAHEDAEGIHIVVSDHGPGIPEQELHQVFLPFYRVEYARSRHTGGTGLGLAIVQSSVEVCGGSVRCRNRRPTGLQVEITLPRLQSQSAA